MEGQGTAGWTRFQGVCGGVGWLPGLRRLSVVVGVFQGVMGHLLKRVGADPRYRKSCDLWCPRRLGVVVDVSNCSR